MKKLLKKLLAVSVIAMLANFVSAAYTGTYGWDDVENVTGNLFITIMVGITEKGNLIGRMKGIAIALSVIVGLIAIIAILLRKFGVGKRGGRIF